MVRNSTFGDLLRTYRRAAGLTHEELASASRLSVRGISDLERGLIGRPRRVTIRLIATALHLGPADCRRLDVAARHTVFLETDHDLVTSAQRPPDEPVLQRTFAPNNLPTEVNSFIGREMDVVDLSGRLRSAVGPRLLTLTGSGGCGKSRLALRVAAESAEAYVHGVWLIDLASLSDPYLVAATIARTIGLAEPATDQEPGVLEANLRQRHVMLVLDNCEHLVDTVARLAESLLRSCPHLRILATSREPIRIPSEVTWRVPSLTLPSSDEIVEPEELLVCESVRLFRDRAISVEPSFALSATNATAVARLCRQLDGIPLAIELAAARLRLFDVEEIVIRLSERFQLLTRGIRTAPRRHQTLRALIDWSYDLLLPAERAVLGRLAVFSGRWTMDAAEAICRDDGNDGGVSGDNRTSHRDPLLGIAVFELVAQLVDKSLVGTEFAGGQRHYRLLETIRAYAEEKLRDSGELAKMRGHHRDWYLALSDAAYPELNGGRHGEWMDRLRAEHENLNAAIAWCRCDAQSYAKGLRLVANLGWYFVSTHRFGEGCRLLDEFLALTPGRDDIYARALLEAVRLRPFRGDLVEARRRCEACLAVADEIGDERTILQASAKLAQVEASEGDIARARARLEDCLATARVLGNGDLIRDWTRDLGTIAIAAGDDEHARTFLEESLVLVGRTGNAGHQAMALLRLSDVDRRAGDYVRARAEAEACWTIFREARVSEDPVLTCLGNLARARGEFTEAQAFLTKVLRRSNQRGDRSVAVEKLCWLGILEIAEGASACGTRHIAAALAENPRFATIHVPDVRREVEASLAQARAALDESTFADAWAEGEALNLEQAITEVLKDPGSRNPVRVAGERFGTSTKG